MTETYGINGAVQHWASEAWRAREDANKAQASLAERDHELAEALKVCEELRDALAVQNEAIDRLREQLDVASSDPDDYPCPHPPGSGCWSCGPQGDDE